MGEKCGIICDRALQAMDGWNIKNIKIITNRDNLNKCGRGG